MSWLKGTVTFRWSQGHNDNTPSNDHKCDIPDSKVHGTNMGPTWVLSVSAGPHVGPINLALRDVMSWLNGCHSLRMWSSASVVTIKTLWRRASRSISSVGSSHPSSSTISRRRPASRASAGRVVVRGMWDIYKEFMMTSWHGNRCKDTIYTIIIKCFCTNFSIMPKFVFLQWFVFSPLQIVHHVMCSIPWPMLMVPPPPPPSPPITTTHPPTPDQSVHPWSYPFSRNKEVFFNKMRGFVKLRKRGKFKRTVDIEIRSTWKDDLIWGWWNYSRFHKKGT